jgi:hypothetical protein
MFFRHNYSHFILINVVTKYHLLQAISGFCSAEGWGLPPLNPARLPIRALAYPFHSPVRPVITAFSFSFFCQFFGKHIKK